MKCSVQEKALQGRLQVVETGLLLERVVAGGGGGGLEGGGCRESFEGFLGSDNGVFASWFQSTSATDIQWSSPFWMCVITS